MNMSWSNIDPNLWDLIALCLCSIALVLGARLAFWGRISKATLTRIIEALSMMVLVSILTNIVLVLTLKRPVPGVDTAIGFAAGWAAYVYSNRYQGDLYGAVGALIFGGVAFLLLGVIPNPLHWAAYAAIVVAAGMVGFAIGVYVYRIRIALGTSLTGAQWLSMVVVGAIQIPRDKSADFLVDQALGYALPGLSFAFDLLTKTGFDLVLVMLGSASFVVLFFIAIQYQLAHLDDIVLGAPATFRELIDELWRKAKQNVRRVALPAVGALVLYFAIVLFFRAQPSAAEENAPSRQDAGVS